MKGKQPASMSVLTTRRAQIELDIVTLLDIVFSIFILEDKMQLNVYPKISPCPGLYFQRVNCTEGSFSDLFRNSPSMRDVTDKEYRLLFSDTYTASLQYEDSHFAEYLSDYLEAFAKFSLAYDKVGRVPFVPAIEYITDFLWTTWPPLEEHEPSPTPDRAFRKWLSLQYKTINQTLDKLPFLWSVESNMLAKVKRQKQVVFIWTPLCNVTSLLPVLHEYVNDNPESATQLECFQALLDSPACHSSPPSSPSSEEDSEECELPPPPKVDKPTLKRLTGSAAQPDSKKPKKDEDEDDDIAPDPGSSGSARSALISSQSHTGKPASSSSNPGSRQQTAAQGMDTSYQHLPRFPFPPAQLRYKSPADATIPTSGFSKTVSFSPNVTAEPRPLLEQSADPSFHSSISVEHSRQDAIFQAGRSLRAAQIEYEAYTNVKAGSAFDYNDSSRRPAPAPRPSATAESISPLPSGLIPGQSYRALPMPPRNDSRSTVRIPPSPRSQDVRTQSAVQSPTAAVPRIVQPLHRDFTHPPPLFQSNGNHQAGPLFGQPPTSSPTVPSSHAVPVQSSGPHAQDPPPQPSPISAPTPASPGTSTTSVPVPSSQFFGPPSQPQSSQPQVSPEAARGWFYNPSIQPMNSPHPPYSPSGFSPHPSVHYAPYSGHREASPRVPRVADYGHYPESQSDLNTRCDRPDLSKGYNFDDLVTYLSLPYAPKKRTLAI